MASLESLEQRVLFSTLTANFNASGGALLKPGLGSLFGVTATATGSDPGLTHGSTLTNSAPADKAGVKSTSPFSLANIAPQLRAAGIKTIVRYADMLSGFPYNWVSLADWDQKVYGETQAIKSSFKDVVRAIAVFNEPDNTMQGAFLTDPALPAGSYDSKVNWLWTHTVQLIRGIDATIPVMGPNYVSYYPQRNSVDQPRMAAFLQNAIATNTVPDLMSWHQLYGGTAADYGVALNNYYRPLEASLGLPKLPLVVEEYGVNNGQFAGIPSAMIPYWAEYERDGVSYASAGVYDNGGTLGNEVSYFSERNQQPNAGWWAANWYMNMSGVSVPTSSATSRYTGAYEGIASFNAQQQNRHAPARRAGRSRQHRAARRSAAASARPFACRCSTSPGRLTLTKRTPRRNTAAIRCWPPPSCSIARTPSTPVTLPPKCSNS